MDARRFDSFAKRFSRRAALTAGGGGLAATLFGLAGRRRVPAAAQDATPAGDAAAAEGGDRAFLFVQAFTGGTWGPKPGEDGVYLLTLTGHAAQTVYFSDRPERLVGTVPTREFLATLGFTPANPPNAAVVAQTPDGGEDVLVVELFDPVYAEAFGEGGGVTVTYEARVLAAYGGEGLRSLAARQGDGQLPAAFGPASLFVDDCPDSNPLRCWNACWADPVGDLGRRGKCWQWWPPQCVPCSGGWDGTARECNEKYPAACNGKCFTNWDANCGF